MEHGKLMGKGNTANVYEWTEDKVIKLFHKDYPKVDIEREFKNAKILTHMNFAKPTAYEIVNYKDQMGIIYDRIKGELLLDMLLRTGNLGLCAEYMANLHKKILNNKICDVQNYKEFLKTNIMRTRESEEREKILFLLEKLPDEFSLCHGDFHPGNIFISDGQTIVIDLMNICHGPLLYDVARTIFLIEYTPVPSETKDNKKLIQVKKRLAEHYLKQMDITRDMIQDYLSVIIAARPGENPDENEVFTISDELLSFEDEYKNDRIN